MCDALGVSEDRSPESKLTVAAASFTQEVHSEGDRVPESTDCMGIQWEERKELHTSSPKSSHGVNTASHGLSRGAVQIHVDVCAVGDGSQGASSSLTYYPRCIVSPRHPRVFSK